MANADKLELDWQVRAWLKRPERAKQTPTNSFSRTSQ